MNNRVNNVGGLRRADDTESRGTRRAFLAASGAVGLGALAGCSAIEGFVDGVSEQAVGTTAASPAAFYAGHARPAVGSDGEAGHVYASGTADVRYVPATVRGADQQIDLEGWATSTTTKAQDYNSSRSNRPRTIRWDGPDGDGDSDTLGRLLDLERALAIQVARAGDAVEGQSADETRAALEGVLATIEDVRTELDGCPTEVCAVVRKNADARKVETQAAIDAVDAGDWKGAAESVATVRRIVEGDVERIRGDLDADGDGLGDGTESLYQYLDDEPTIGEHFAVSLPAAELPGGGGALADELTPRRLLAYLTGERDAEGCLDTGDAVVVHRDLACRTLLTSRLDEQPPARRRVVGFETEGGAVVTGASPDLDGAARMLRVSGATIDEPSSLDSWGPERTSGEAAVTPTLVRPVLATPPDCPCPVPALLSLQRIRHDDQLLYTGGWLLDEGALYEDAATLLVSAGPPAVVGIAAADIEGSDTDLRALVTARKRPGRAKYGNIVLRKSHDADADYLPDGTDSTCAKKGYDYWQAQSRTAFVRGGGDCDDSDDAVFPESVVAALDAPILHLVDAAAVANDVKFKAGAELSKAAN